MRGARLVGGTVKNRNERAPLVYSFSTFACRISQWDMDLRIPLRAHLAKQGRHEGLVEPLLLHRRRNIGLWDATMNV